MRSMAFAAPGLLLAYGILRWIDGLDGHRKGGPAWDLGHAAFLASIVLFAALAVGLARRATIGRRLAAVAAVAVGVGAACFAVVILHDLSVDVGQIPGPVTAAGPILFVLGLIGLYSLEVAADRLPLWSPILTFFAFSAITLNLNLLPPAAVVILVATAPIGSRRPLPARAAGSPSPLA